MTMKKFHVMMMVELWWHISRLYGTVMGGREVLFHKEIVQWISFFPTSILIKAWLTWDSITFTWDAVEGASSYQIEVDGGNSLESATKNTFTKSGLLQDTEHSLRVRAVSRTGFVSRWSDVFRGKKVVALWRCMEGRSW